jgi:NTP pyrophosphatase (non-canonical NTP hydrolase)
MEVRAMQEEAAAWIESTATGYFSPLAMLARLTEEVGELAREVNHAFGEKPKRPDEPPVSLAMEIGDVLFVVVCFANALGIDLESAFRAVMEKYRRRDGERWGRVGTEEEPPPT